MMSPSGTGEDSRPIDIVSCVVEPGVSVGSMIRLIDPRIVLGWYEYAFEGVGVVDFEGSVSHEDLMQRRLAAPGDLALLERGVCQVLLEARITDEISLDLMYAGDIVELSASPMGVLHSSSTEARELFGRVLERLVSVVPFAQVVVNVEPNRTYGSAFAAGFDFRQDQPFGVCTHSPIMYLRGDAVSQLDESLLSRVDDVVKLGGPVDCHRVEVDSSLEYPISARDLAFDLIAPVRVERRPVLSVSHDRDVEPYSLSSIEAALIVITNATRGRDRPDLELPDWHPDADADSGHAVTNSYGYPAQLKLNDAVVERSRDMVFPSWTRRDI